MEANVSLHLRAVRAAAALRCLGERALADIGFTMAQFEFLETIARHARPRSISRHARELGVKQTTLSLRARALEAAGLVERIRRGPRRTEVRLTDGGRNALALLRERWRAVERSLAEQLGDEALAKMATSFTLLTDPALGVSDSVAPLPGEFVKSPAELIALLQAAQREAAR